MRRGEKANLSVVAPISGLATQGAAVVLRLIADHLVRFLIRNEQNWSDCR